MPPNSLIEFFQPSTLPDLLIKTAAQLSAHGVEDIALQWSPAPTPPTLMEANSSIVWHNFQTRFGASSEMLAKAMTRVIQSGLEHWRAETLIRQQWLVRKTGPFRLCADAPDEYRLSVEEHRLPREFGYTPWQETFLCPISRERDRVLFLAARTDKIVVGDAVSSINETLLAFWYAYHCLFITSVVGDAPGAEDNSTQPLSSREIECLHWLAAGKTISESAIILGISERTLRFHVNNARERLGVATTTQAIVAATLKHGFHTSDARKSVYKISRQA